MIKIPKKLGHIWIGENEAPYPWMQTWVEKHPDWEYKLYDNSFLKSFNFKNRKIIDFYLNLEWYAGVADVMRYEILYEYGGFLPEADSICYHNTDELFTKESAYTVYENEFIRGKLVSPILACEPKNPFVKTLIDELAKLSIRDLDDPWRTTGNLFVAKMIEKYSPDIVIFPSYYFIPMHYTGIAHQNDDNDKVYAKQMFGSTTSYPASSIKKGFLSHKFQQYQLKKKRKQLDKKRNIILERHKTKRLELLKKSTL